MAENDQLITILLASPSPPDLVTGSTGRGVEGVDDCSWCDVDRDLHSLAATGNLRGGCQLYSAQGRLQSLVRKGEGE